MLNFLCSRAETSIQRSLACDGYPSRSQILKIAAKVAFLLVKLLLFKENLWRAPVPTER